MIQTVIVPDSQVVNLSLTIPESYIGKELEIIAFARNEGWQNKELPKKFNSFDSIKIDTTDSIKIDTTNFQFNRDEADER